MDGVIQEPSVAYAVSNGTTLTFTAAPSSNSGNNIFVYYLFRTVGTVGHPSNQALSATTGTFTGNVIIPNAGNIGSASDTDAMAISSGGVVNFTQTPTISSLNISNTPAFEATRESTRQELGANNTGVKVQFNNEVYDTDNAFDSSTNYRFTPQVAGSYFVYAYLAINPEVASNLDNAYAILKKNGSTFAVVHDNFANNPIRFSTQIVTAVISLNGSSDYVECFAQAGDNSGTADIDYGGYTRFGAYRLIGI